jgi:ABC-2 type transport system ATP-binding protein
MWNYILGVNEKEGMTVFFTTHYMEEAEKMSQRTAIIDRGKIIACGSAEELMKQTRTASLEAAFLQLTGSTIRDEKASGADRMRIRRRVWGR